LKEEIPKHLEQFHFLVVVVAWNFCVSFPWGKFCVVKNEKWNLRNNTIWLVWLLSQLWMTNPDNLHFSFHRLVRFLSLLYFSIRSFFLRFFFWKFRLAI
jgi:hypothetical protein